MLDLNIIKLLFFVNFFLRQMMPTLKVRYTCTFKTNILQLTLLLYLTHSYIKSNNFLYNIILLLRMLKKK